MIDFGIDKLALIGAVALVVIGPEKLPRVARTVGVLLGKAKGYVAQVQSEVNRTIELEDLQKMKAEMESAAQAAQSQFQTEAAQFTGQFSDHGTDSGQSDHNDFTDQWQQNHPLPTQRPRKNWRLKKGATPLWYKQQHGVKRHVQSGAARVARFRPPGLTR